MTDDGKVIPFGKYKGYSVTEVATFDPQYLTGTGCSAEEVRKMFSTSGIYFIHEASFWP